MHANDAHDRPDQDPGQVLDAGGKNQLMGTVPQPSSSIGSSAAKASPYTLRISRLTIDKLGVKLYDKVSAAVAELIANSYDADATEVVVEVPLGTELASKDKDTNEITDKGYEISVIDDGHGMTPQEARAFYLQVGRDRRTFADQGDRSREKKRPVMGRKGIGKLAPFGICRVIEVRSAGGPYVEGKGHLVTHFFLDFDQIVRDTDEPVPLRTGDRDETYEDKRGTTITLTQFLPKRVPAADVFHRQVATRFALASPDFAITIRDTKQTPPSQSTIEQFHVAIADSTKVDASLHPVPFADGESLPVTGWLAMAKEAYKNEEGAGVRIYARGKIVATTRDFEQPAGFTGEFTMRSYLVGEVHADWLDEGEDLIRTDRQSILWDSDRGQALRDWGAEIIKKIAAGSAKPRRERKSRLFMEQAKIRERARTRYSDAMVVEIAVELGEQIGAFAAEDELADADYVEGLAEIILAVAPHQALVSAFKAISNQQDATIDQLLELFSKTRVAEMASYGQIASERVQSVKELQDIINDPNVEEADLQRIISSAPWLIRPDWSVVSQNQSLKTFRDQFVAFWKSKFDSDLDVAISFESKRPDFTLIHHGRQLHIVEIKSPGHQFASEDYKRLQNYVDAFDEFFASNPGMTEAFPDKWVIDLVADGVKLTDSTQRHAFEAFQSSQRVIRQTWNDFLKAATTAHEGFLDAYDQIHAEGDEAAS